ncbi:MAG TPA: DUF1206 domain-containing protein [Streptosporangiaceae bacterium]|nr:DUF1206 domain-containing protein [Streptosporangiaceae bacterium]
MTANVAGGEVRRAGREAAGSPWFHRLSRAGLVARGVIYLLIGSLAVRIGLGDGGKEADRKGALQTVADTPGGEVLLWLLVVGFAGLALWRFAEAVYGQPAPDGKAATKRLASLGRGVFYGVACAAILNFALGGGAQSSNEQSKTFTAKAMGEPGGRWLVLAIGAGFVAWGVGNIVNAVRRKFTEKLQTGRMSPRVRKAVEVVGFIGRSARGLVFGAVGVFLAYAALTFDPDKAKGLDGTLRSFAETPAGPWALVAVAAGLVTFGVYSFCEARWRKVEAVRS